jgi:hypothetical protein
MNERQIKLLAPGRLIPIGRTREIRGEEVPGAGVRARHPDGFAAAGDRAERSRLAEAERRPDAEPGTEGRVRARDVGRLALVEAKIATEIRSGRAGSPVLVSAQSRWDRVATVLDLADGYRQRSVPAVENAPNVSRRRCELLVIVVGLRGRRAEKKTAGAATPTAVPSAETVFIWQLCSCRISGGRRQSF